MINLFFKKLFYKSKVLNANKKDVAIYNNEDQISNLKNEIFRLENDINISLSILAEIEKLIHDFSIIHNRILGELVYKILKIKLEKFDEDDLNNNEKLNDYNNAKKDYEDFTKDYEESKSQKLKDLNNEESKLLKLYYRKASKLCHPDLISEELKEKAESIFKELHNAYQENNIEKVLEILNMLENGDFFVSKSEKITESTLLKAEIENLKIKLENINAEINLLKTTETYQTLIKINNWDKYFEETKQQLIIELDTLSKK